MPGIRIHHLTARDCVVVVPHPGDVAGPRKAKDYRIAVDHAGDAIVSETIWRRLEEAKASGCSVHDFLVLNMVSNPPTQVIGEVGAASKRVFRQTEPGHLQEMAGLATGGPVARHTAVRH